MNKKKFISHNEMSIAYDRYRAMESGTLFWTDFLDNEWEPAANGWVLKAETADRLKMFVESPHWRTLFKAWKAKHG